MFDSPFDPITQVLAIIFTSLVLAIAAIIFARKAYVRVEELRARLEALEAMGGMRATPAAPPPLPQFERAPPSASAVSPEPTPGMRAPEATRPVAEAPAFAPPPPLPPGATDEAGFEERIGTRWVVWI